MGLIDRFLNAIKLNDDFDDDEDFLDEEDDSVDDLDEELGRAKPKRRFFSKFSADEEDDEDDATDDDAYESRRSRSSQKKTEPKKRHPDRSSDSISSRQTERQTAYTSRNVGYASRGSSPDRTQSSYDSRKKQQKVTPIRKKGSLSNMEVNVIRPSSMEDTRDIADTLMENCTVVLNLEGLDVDIAQRVIDFTCGVCYSLHGNLQKVSSYIFILTPENVELSGDFQSILSGAFDLTPMRSSY